MNRYVAFLCALGCSVPGLSAQSVRGNALIPRRPAFADSIPDARNAPIRLTVGDAEAEGAAWVRRSEPTFQPVTGGADHWVDSGSRECVAVESAGPIRAGDFVIGGEILRSTVGRQVRIWWEPMHPAESFSLVVRGARLSPAPDTLRYGNPGWAIGGSPSLGAVGPIFYASGFTFPSSGRWLLIATSGPDWGCFIVTTS